jgi:polysaccharide deacetylase 2 family uncharacterized protein YibQ
LSNQTKKISRKRGPERKFRWWHAVAVILVIAAVFLLLERLKSGFHKDAVKGIQPVETGTISPRIPAESEQRQYTSVRPAPLKKTGSPAPSYQVGTVAIIVDDMGSSLKEADDLLSIGIPITFSIIPGLQKVKGVAAAAKASGRDVMIHIPMEPQGYPKQRLEANGLLVAYSADELASRLEKLLEAVPDAVGANNHMGSRFTEIEEKMSPVLGVLKKHGLFFIDSRTTPLSKGFELSHRMGLKSATRNVFLDNEQDVAAIKKQLNSAVVMARKKGGVIAICHPHPSTIAALKEAVPELQKTGIRFVSARELVR